ncbi:helix-turn-helix domain-containing protein [Butyrivibrio sp. VCB2006]|uniref:helix-turn-helix domain-containing protein n=1 Tax=Butyrivibrio sp. VCB2006 TaxID=1280679 RepID=UPI000492C572|nr:helix-turn-helix transcriptional regulator [Butyrivibrio sp. VCB2006]
MIIVKMNLTIVKHLIRWIKSGIINVIDWRINIGKMNEFEIMIGKNIKEVRTQKGLSQEVLAKKCGFSNTTLSSYENSRKIPSLTTIATIAKQLGVSIERLYYGDENSAFIISEPDEGKKIVNAVYFLWKARVIFYYENYIPGMYSTDFSKGDDKAGIFLQLVRHTTPIKRLINSLNEFQRNLGTYPEPEKYLEMLFSSVAAEINLEIKNEKAAEEQQRAKQKAAAEKQATINATKKALKHSGN